MNNTVSLNRRVSKQHVPAWLVVICRIILWITSEPVSGTLRAAAAIAAVMAIALVAGAMDFGAIPLTYGIVICGALAGIALRASQY